MSEEDIEMGGKARLTVFLLEDALNAMAPEELQAAVQACAEQAWTLTPAEATQVHGLPVCFICRTSSVDMFEYAEYMYYISVSRGYSGPAPSRSC
jgi:hypothetical protein